MTKQWNVRCLYVEDDEKTRNRMRSILERRFTNVFFAVDGRQGVDAFVEFKPDLVITDVRMPVMGGLEMARRIRRIDPEMKIIFTTAHSDTDYLLRAIEMGINHYVLKPVELDKLDAAIHGCVQALVLRMRLEEVERMKNEALADLKVALAELKSALGEK